MECLPGTVRVLDFGAKDIGMVGTGGRLVGDDGLVRVLLMADAGRSGGRIGLESSRLK